jgi:hypothetical protein
MDKLAHILHKLAQPESITLKRARSDSFSRHYTIFKQCVWDIEDYILVSFMHDSALELSTNRQSP